MKAVIRCDYGSPDALKVADVQKPAPGPDEILVKVRAASVNPLDWHMMEGTPYLMRIGTGLRKPTDVFLGVDYAGTVERVGSNVTQFTPGDDVFGGRDGALAEYICVRADHAVVRKPAAVTFEQAAALPVAGVTALQGLRDKGRIAAGQKVLINGASGGVGTFAVQIAKSLGGEVTGVCSTKHIALVKSLGADRVIDYTKENFANSGVVYDLILDNVGTQPLSAFRHVLSPSGRYVAIGGGGTHDQGITGPFPRILQAWLLSHFTHQKLGMMLAELNKRDLSFLAGMIESGQLKPVIDRDYKSLGQVAEAMRYLEQGHAAGKIIVNID
ncbi:MAG: NAD(P)-dependent alcohol dehydrogenase [Verrucomicrobia bacterium]|nr:NAD(P)-dependent alcohol dehydrogenase [Verrucomicrobiota bacterium]